MDTNVWEVERKPPTQADKVEALWNYWKFLDILDFHGGSSAFGECHRDLIQWSDEHNSSREFVIMPRGHLKSTLLTVGRTLWRIYQNPNIRIFVGTATKDLAIAFIREIKTYFEDDWLQEFLWNARPHIEGRLVPVMDKLARQRRIEMYDDTDAEDKKVVWRTDAIQVIRPDVLKEPTVCVGAVGVRHTGFHFDEMKLDDVVNYDNISTPDKLKKLKRWVGDLNSVLDPAREDVRLKRILPPKAKRYAKVGGSMTIVGTRYAKHDWYDELLERPRYAIYQRNIYKNGTSAKGGYLWHEFWNEDIEQEKRDEMTTAEFASQYLNMIINPEEQTFGMEQVRILAPHQVRLLKSGLVEITLAEDDTPRVIRPYCVVDPAASVLSSADYTAIVVGGRDENKNLYIIDLAVGRWKALDMMRQMYKLLDKWQLNRVAIEAVSGFKHFVEAVKMNFRIFRPITIFEFKPQGNKQWRISNALEPLMRNGMFFMSLWVSQNQEVKDEITYFPQETVHDDVLDAMAALSELAKAPTKAVYRPMKGFVNSSYGGFR